MTRNHETVHRFRVEPDGAASLAERIERAAHATASRWCGGLCVAASVGQFHLDRPIDVGEWVELHAALVYTGRCSMHVLVTIHSVDVTSRTASQTAQCPIVFVAVNEAGSPVEVPPWTPVTMLDLQRQRQARVRIRMRKQIDEVMASANYVAEGVATQQFRASDRLSAGLLMRWIEEAACACGADWIGAQAITGYVAGVRFCRSIREGDLVTVTARVIHTGPRSVHTWIQVTTAGHDLAALGVVVVVSPDEQGRARPVPVWAPACDDERRFDGLARQLIELRQFNEPFTTAVA